MALARRRRAQHVVAALLSAQALRAPTPVSRPRRHISADAAADLAPSEKGVVRAAPKVVTIDPLGTLVRRAGPEGLLYRDALLAATGLMLPRPDIFQGFYEAAVAQAPPRFGTNDKGAEDWWKKVTKATYDAVLTAPDQGVGYDADEMELYENAFDELFASLHGDLTLGEDAWVVSPDAPRLLSALRAWRYGRGGPRVVAATDAFDDRLETLLSNALGEDCVAATFDHVITGTGQASCFDIVSSTMDVADAACKHVAVEAPAACPWVTLVVDPRDYENERADDARGSLLDLLDDWGLERAEGDDVVVTSRTYSVYDAEYPGFDGENMDTWPCGPPTSPETRPPFEFQSGADDRGTSAPAVGERAVWRPKEE